MSEIKGYEPLSDEQVALMNEIKEHGAALGELVERLQALPDTNKRWVSIGATHLQQGGMALTRSVANPSFFF